MDIDVKGLKESTWERNTYLSCAVLIVYEYFLQLDAEVEFFWERRWSLAKALFLWSRYYGLAFNLANAVVFMQQHPSPDLCDRFFHWQNTGASLQVITTHLILQLRIWAMYGNSRRMLFFLILLTVCEGATMGVIFGVPRSDLVATHHPLPGVFICADADPSNGQHWQVYYWMTILVVDFILLCLAIRKAWEERFLVHNRLMREVTVQSVAFFMGICWIYVVNMIIWIINKITLNELCTAFSFAIPSIFANRLLIYCRRAHQPEDTFTSLISTFLGKGLSQETWEESCGNVELTPFNATTA